VSDYCRKMKSMADGLRDLSFTVPEHILVLNVLRGLPSSYEVVRRLLTHQQPWLRQLLAELRSPLAKSTLVYCDNISAVYLSTNPVQHQRTKHVEIDLHFVRDRMAIGDVRVLHVPTTSQFTDIFTKGLPSSTFSEFRSSLNVASGYLWLRGALVYEFLSLLASLVHRCAGSQCIYM
jgi:hypothetical protein